jgi:transposase-like protein
MSRTKIRSEEQIGLVETYTNSITQVMSLASKARGPRTSNSIEHKASEEFNNLVLEYIQQGGMIQDLADSLGVSYHTLRRRAKNAEAPIQRAPNSKRTADEYPDVLHSLAVAKQQSTIDYHAEILRLYEDGFSINRLAKMMGMASPYPLYYGLQTARERRKTSVA